LLRNYFLVLQGRYSGLHFTGEVDKYVAFWFGIFSDFMHQKLLKLVHFLRSYSRKNMVAFFLDHAV